MNWKLLIIGGLVFWIVTNILGIFVTGYIVHNSILMPVYKETASFWRPELNQDPPDMAAMMPYWLATSLLISLIVAGIYGCVRPCLQGPGWKRGLMWGLCLGIFICAMELAYSGVFNLPMTIWIWWGIEALFLYLIGGAAMGWAGEKWASEG